jgi:hypothetical protein
MDGLSHVERLCAYTSATGLPPTGGHRRLTNQLLVRLGAPCNSCNRTGGHLCDGRHRFCVDCHEFLLRLVAHEVVRLYQIVTVRFSEQCSRAPVVQEAADQWYAGSLISVTAPRYFGREPLPASAPLSPDENAQLIASVTSRNGGRSEYLQTVCDDICILWERIPELLLDDGHPWTEVFGCARGGVADPRLSARRLLYLGWSATNPAYERLASPSMARFYGLTKYFSAASDGMPS